MTRGTASKVFFVNGTVVFGNAERNRFQPVTVGSKIQNEDTIRTSTDAVINLALVPGVLVRLTSNSEIRIEELTLRKDGNETAGGMFYRRARIRLNRGNMSILFSGPDKSVSSFAVTTNQTTITPDSDCLFGVWTNGASTRVTCGRGEVTASGDGQAATKIAAGYFYLWPAASTDPIVASGDPDAQVDIKTSLAAEKELLEQAARWQNRCLF